MRASSTAAQRQRVVRASCDGGTLGVRACFSTAARRRVIGIAMPYYRGTANVELVFCDIMEFSGDGGRYRADFDGLSSARSSSL